MSSKSSAIAAAKFKAQCLALLDRVERTGEHIVVTKRGRPVAEVVPIKRSEPRSLRGSVTVLGDIVSPAGESWDAEQ